MVKNDRVLIQNDLRERLTFPSGEGNLSRTSLWIKRLALLAILNCRFWDNECPTLCIDVLWLSY